MASRGIRNNNPGNIRVGSAWKGRAASGDMAPEQAAEKAFVVFRAPWWGIRAMAIILRTYHRNGFDTISKIVKRWAPKDDNNPVSAYTKFVSEKSGIGPYNKLNINNVHQYAAVIAAMCEFECGEPIDGENIVVGLDLAGFKLPVDSRFYQEKVL